MSLTRPVYGFQRTTKTALGPFQFARTVRSIPDCCGSFPFCGRPAPNNPVLSLCVLVPVVRGLLLTFSGSVVPTLGLTIYTASC